MKTELSYAIEKLMKASARLSEGLASVRDDLDRDGILKRFEFTFEQLWKTLKILLEREGIYAKTPREVLKEAFRLGWIEHESVFSDMLTARNRSSHIYDFEETREIFEQIKTKYAQAISELTERISEMANK